MSETGSPGDNGPGQVRDHLYASQNVRGFKSEQRRRQQWMQAWKTRITGGELQGVMIQETHVGTSALALQLERLWCRVWGIRWTEETRWSFWSTGSSASAGTAILLNPHGVSQFTAHRPEEWTKHAIAAASSDTLLVSVYAPGRHDRAAQAECFERVESLATGYEGALLVGGDFNCVVDPELDRRSCGSSLVKPTENATLSAVLLALDLIDPVLARVPECPTAAERDEHVAATHTFGTRGTSARLDRFYISAAALDQVQQVTARQPLMASDHRMVVLRRRPPDARWTYKRPARVYPVAGLDDDEVQGAKRRDEIEHLLDRELDKPTIDLDHVVRTVKARLIHSTKTWKKKCSRKRRRRCKRARRGGTVVDIELVRRREATQRVEAARAHGRQLLDRGEGSQWFYERLATSDRDQGVTTLTHAGDPSVLLDPSLPLPEKMVEAWRPVFTSSHGPRSARWYNQQLRDFCHLPPTRRLTQADREALLRPFELDEVVAAFRKLARGKSCGPDRLPNEFFRDYAESLVPIFLRATNEFLRGGPLPLGFQQSLVVPLRKNGDNPDALQYRPISLLSSAYKVYAHLLSARVKPVLGRLIGPQQHGFLTDRQLEDALHTMQVMLQRQFADAAAPAEESPVIVCLDFAKAYDSLERRYLEAVMRWMGFGSTFVARVAALHADTTGVFQVNGVESQPFPITRGIRQGCPLAPLLFLIAVEPLALGFSQDPRVQGMRLPTSPSGRQTDSDRHVFTAFVDDSG